MRSLESPTYPKYGGDTETYTRDPSTIMRPIKTGINEKSIKTDQNSSSHIINISQTAIDDINSKSEVPKFVARLHEKYKDSRLNRSNIEEHSDKNSEPHLENQIIK